MPEKLSLDPNTKRQQLGGWVGEGAGAPEFGETREKFEERKDQESQKAAKNLINVRVLKDQRH